MPSSLTQINYSAFKDVPNTTKVFFYGTIQRFINITDFDWDCINLYVKGFRTTIFASVLLTSVLVVLVVWFVLINKKKEKTEDEQNEN